MKKLLALVLGLAGLYGGYWFVGQTAVEKGLRAWFAERQADGWVAEYESLETIGFPSRFDTTITKLELADPASGLAWSAPWFQVLALSYQPQHYIAVWPQDQVIANPDHKYQIHADVMKASVVFERGLAFTLDHSAMELGNFKVTRDDGQVIEIRKGVFATRQNATIENAHDVAFDLAGYKPDLGNLRIMDPQDKLPDEIDGAKIDMTIGFDAPWNRYSIEDKRPQPTLIDLKIIKATWGELDLEIAGKLDIDRAGIPTGDITIRAKNWREILEILINMRVVPADYKNMVERGVAILGAATGDPNNLDVTLTFADGQMSLGFIPLGRAPTLNIR